MECPEKWDSLKNKSIFQLITKLCEKIATTNDPFNDFAKLNRPLIKKLRSKAYEIILKKSDVSVPREPHEPTMDMLSYYYDRNCHKDNIGDYNDLANIKEKIDWVIDRKKEEVEPYFYEILSLVVSLKNSVPNDRGRFMFENPFSFGKLDDILPHMAHVNKSDPKPYQHFPAEIFQMPFTITSDLDNIQNNKSTPYPYLIESFQAKPCTKLTHIGKSGASYLAPSCGYSSKESQQSSLMSMRFVKNKSEEGFPDCPRLVGPRYLNIPTDESNYMIKNPVFNINHSQDSFVTESERVIESGPAATLWELASMDINIESDLWEKASKLPMIEKRGFISSSLSQMSYWKQLHLNRMDKLHVISEAQFILHLKYLTIGIESSSFIFDKTSDKFIMKRGLCLEGLLQITLKAYIYDLLKIGTCYWRLNHLVRPSLNDQEIKRNSYVYKAMCDNIRHYLVWFRLEIDKVFGEGLITIEHEGKRLPTLMEIINKLKPLAIQIKTMARVCNIYDIEMNEDCLRGAGLMAYLYNEIMMVTESSACAILYATLQATCSIYFRFIQKFIFEGELEDNFDEFFIKKDLQNVESFNKRYWNKGFIIRNNEIVPEFLRGLAKYILLCGKSLRLLKLCNPDDPLCVMLSSDYPDIKCCLTFDEIENQQILYDQYRTQCLYVCGEPITFQRLLIQRDAEKRAFREMVALKQAETMEKLIEERKRLSRMLQANKRKQFAALRKAAEIAMARRDQEREDNIKEERLLLECSKASDKIYRLKLEEEKKKVLIFYDEIEKEVNERQMIAEWKIKRLRLDVRRVELLTSEKLNLDRERLELECKNYENNEDVILNYNNVPPSITPTLEKNTVISEQEQSCDSLNSDKNTEIVDVIEVDHSKSMRRDSLNILIEKESIPSKKAENNQIYALAKAASLDDDIEAINKMTDIINSNIVSNIKEYESSSQVDFSPSDIANSNVTLSSDKNFASNCPLDMYSIQKLQALRNKRKVLSHEFGMQSEDSIITPDENKNPQLLSLLNNNLSEAHRNRLKILGSNFNSEPVIPDHNFNETPQYNTDACREALKNKQKVLGHEFGIDISTAKTRIVKQRDNLTLDLGQCKKPHLFDWAEKDMKKCLPNIPDAVSDSCSNTPGDFVNLRLDIETPSTFDIGPFGLPSSTTLSPTSALVNESNNDTKHITTQGFRFPNIVEEHHSDEETVPDGVTSNEEPITLPGTKTGPLLYNTKSSVWNFIDDDLNFDDFKPFGIETTANNDFKSLDVFDRHLTLENDMSPYSDIYDIIKHAEKKPMSDIFKMISAPIEIESLLKKVEDVDFSTIATCLQRSVMIPLSCQMEMVNNATLKYFLVNCDLYDHLKNIRDYFFLMDGEFAKTICTNLFEKLNTTESPKELLNFATLHSILDKSFGSSICGMNKYAENLSFIVNDMPTSFHHSSPDVLECLTLSYTIGWPLNIIFSQEAMDRYAKVFQFLVKIRRISWALEHDCEVLKMSLKEEFMVSKELLFSPQYHSIQLYRYIMSSLIRALHSYISTTCLQSSWTEFEKDLMNASTLDDLYSIHVIYIKKVLFRCLLNNRSSSIMNLLNDIFSMILKFHHLLNARSWHIAVNEVHYTHPLFSEMRKLFIKFDKTTKYFHKMVTRLTDCGYQPHLAELLSVINMNDYYKSGTTVKV